MAYGNTSYAQIADEIKRQAYATSLPLIPRQRLRPRSFAPCHVSAWERIAAYKEAAITDIEAHDHMNGNKLTVTWNTTRGRINKVTDTGGTDGTFNYNAQGLLTSVTGLGWSVNFIYDASNRPATRPSPVLWLTHQLPLYNTQWQFTYNAASGLLE